jgi:glutamate dehydrogenase
VPDRLQRELYASVQDLLRDRLVWFLRNADLAKGLDQIVDHYRKGIMTVESALAHVLTGETAARRAARETELTRQGVPEALARRCANLTPLVGAPDIVSVADRTQQSILDVAATYFAAQSYFRLDRIAEAARAIDVSDYFDRLALDRALDQIGDAKRRIAAAMAGNGAAGGEAVEAWIAPRRQEADRIRAQVQDIANSGLTVSKLTVAASLLGDLARP